MQYRSVKYITIYKFVFRENSGLYYIFVIDERKSVVMGHFKGKRT